MKIHATSRKVTQPPSLPYQMLSVLTAILLTVKKLYQNQVQSFYCLVSQSVRHSILLLNFAQFSGFVIVVIWISLKKIVKSWWPLFLALKFTFLFLNLAKIQIFIPKSAYGGRGSAGSGIIPKKNSFFTASLTRKIKR